MTEFKVLKPKDIAEACALLREGNYKPLAGGSDLVVKIRSGLYENLDGLVYIGNLPFKEIKIVDNALLVGSGCTMAEIIANPLVVEHFPVLVQAALTVGSVQIRQVATIGGNVGNASPAGDTIAALYALDAQLQITNGETHRLLPVDEFFMGPGRVALEQGELIEGFWLPLNRTSGAFKKLGERTALAISKINLALSVWQEQEQEQEQDQDQSWQYRIALGSVGPKVIRVPEAEKLLAQAPKPLTDEVIQQAAALAKTAAKPISDIRSTAAYRKEMAGVLLRKALEETR
jgi:xanthine dehydrogenase FAD-binding subunit